MTLTPAVPDYTFVAEDSPYPIGLVFASKTGGLGHVVIRIATDPPAVACTCPAMLSLAKRPQGCWAMQKARSLMGLEEV